MDARSSVADVSAVLRCAQPSLPQPLMYLCGTANQPHKGLRAGGMFRGKLPMRCPACNAKGAA